MKFAPSSKTGWSKFWSFPCKAYIIIAALWALATSFMVENVPGLSFMAHVEATGEIMLGSFVCVLLLFIDAGIQFIQGYKRIAYTTLIWAIVSFIVLYFISPLVAYA